MAIEDELAIQMKQDISGSLRRVSQYPALSAGEHSVTILDGEATRTIQKIKGVPIESGDQVLVIRVGSGEIALGAVSAAGIE